MYKNVKTQVINKISKPPLNVPNSPQKSVKISTLAKSTPQKLAPDPKKIPLAIAPNDFQSSPKIPKNLDVFFPQLFPGEEKKCPF